MTLPTNIVIIGAGSAEFAENTFSNIMACERLRGSALSLVDINAEMLETSRRLAERINREWNSDMKLRAYPHHREALEGAQFVVSAIEMGPREELWKKDFELTLKHGLRQPYGENGGPGAFAHAARNILPLMEIIRDMEAICPQAWFVNFSNPMTRLCDAVNRHSKIRSVGLCHQIYAGYVMVGAALAQDLGIEVPPELNGLHAAADQYMAQYQVRQQIVPRVDIRAAGTNHFTWMLSIRDRQTGEDLYPLFRKRFLEMNPAFEPLTRDVFETFGLCPAPGDTHLCEYLPWVSDPSTRPWEKYDIKLYDWEMMTAVRAFKQNRLESMADGELTLDGLRETDSEGALEMIENIAGGTTHYHLAANLPNDGQIANLPIGATVETPIMVDGAGVHPVHVGALPGPIAELCRRELTVAQLCVEAALEGSREKALQCLLLDPTARDIQTTKNILEDILVTFREYLPQFWK